MDRNINRCSSCRKIKELKTSSSGKEYKTCKECRTNRKLNKKQNKFINIQKGSWRFNFAGNTVDSMIQNHSLNTSVT